jgi:methylmalonyl-CoA/ethylmalonyl-CoA epimerase
MRDAQHAVQLNEISQIALTVSDLKRAQDFYQNTLGMKFLFEAATMVFFKCGSIRLMIGASKEAAVGGTILYFKVRDIHAVHESLKGWEVEFVDEPHLVAKMPDHDLWMAFLKDPDGNTLGLMSEVRRSSSAK